jgi:hypothetical protein
MPEPIEVEGVKFTPEKTVDFDEYLKQKAAAEKTEAPDPTPTPEVPEVPEPKAEDPAPEDPKGPETPAVEDKEIPLEEITLEVDGEEIQANEIVDRYSKTKEELDSIKKDEFLNRFIEFYKGGGDPAEFLGKATQKWDQVSDFELIRRDFYEKNTDLDDEAKEIFFERKLSELYGVNLDGSFDEEDSKTAKIGKQLMKRDAKSLRDTRIEEQKKFLLPENKSQETSKQPQINVEAIRQDLLKDKDISEFVKTKSIPVGEGLVFETDQDPNKVIGMMTNVSDFWKLFQNQDGSPNKALITKVFTFALDPSKYDARVLELGKDLGAEQYLKEQRNTSSTTQKVNVVDKSLDREEVVVVNGKIVKGNSTEFIKAGVAQRKK